MYWSVGSLVNLFVINLGLVSISVFSNKSFLLILYCFSSTVSLILCLNIMCFIFHPLISSPAGKPKNPQLIDEWIRQKHTQALYLWTFHVTPLTLNHIHYVEVTSGNDWEENRTICQFLMWGSTWIRGVSGFSCWLNPVWSHRTPFSTVLLPLPLGFLQLRD